ncbi:hypothetical protein Tco_0546515 [Tanacetum coccineum]
MLRVRTSSRGKCNEARDAKDTLVILLWDSVMSSASTVTYTSVYTDSEPGRVFWGADEELSDGGPEHPPSPAEVPYIPEPEYPEYLVPFDDEAPWEDQPLLADASPIALLPGYVADSDLEEDPKEDPKEDHADYPADGGDGDNEPSDDDDDDTNDEDEEPFKDEDDDEEEDNLAPADFVIAPTVDFVPSSEETEPFETDESTATPPSPPTHRTTARISIRPEAPMPFPSEEEVERLLALPPPPPSPLISLLPPSAEERLARCLAVPALPSSPLSIVPHPYGGGSLIATPRPTGGHRVDYGFIGTLDAEIRRQRAKEVGYGIWVDPREAVEELAPTTLKGVNARVIELAAVQEQDTQDIYAVIEDTQDKHTQLFQRVNGLVKDRQFHQETALLLD